LALAAQLSSVVSGLIPLRFHSLLPSNPQSFAVSQAFGLVSEF
jgi:hypothetical protein